MNRRFCCLIIGVAVVCAGAYETAITQSGRKVILRNDGTWELFDANRHVEMSDVRAQAPKVEISLKYRDYVRCSQELRAMMEADELSEAQILDSLKTIPAGGEVVVQTPTATLNLKDPRTFLYTIKDAKGKVLLQKEISESLAQQADEADLSNLTTLALPAFGKGNLVIDIMDKATHQLFEYTIEVERH